MTNKNDIEKFFKAYYRQMYQMARIILHDDDSARYIVHDVFESLLYVKVEFNVSQSYLISAVRNRCLNQIRDKGIHDRILNLYFTEIDDYETEDWPDAEAIARIYQIIKEQLTPKCQRIMELRFIEGQTFSKIAEQLAVSEKAVYKQVRQALVIIRNDFKQDGQV